MFSLLLVFGLIDRPAPQVIKLLPECAWCVRIWLFQDSHTDSSSLTAAAGRRVRGRGLVVRSGRPQGRNQLRMLEMWVVMRKYPSSGGYAAARELDFSDIYRICSFLKNLSDLT